MSDKVKEPILSVNGKKMTNRQMRTLDEYLGQSVVGFLKDEEKLLSRHFVAAIIAARTGKTLDAATDGLPLGLEEFTDLAISEAQIVMRTLGMLDVEKTKGRKAAKVKR